MRTLDCVALFLSSLVAMGCGGSSSDDNATDSGASIDSTVDGGGDTAHADTSSDAHADTLADASTDANETADAGDATTDGDGGAIATGTLLVPHGRLLAVTDDDQVLHVVDGSVALAAIPIAGGTATTVDPAYVTVKLAYGDVFTVSAIAAGGVATLQVWSVAAGAHVLSTKTVGAYVDGPYTALRDGSVVAFASNAASDGNSADIVIANRDGSAPKTVLTGVDTDGATCLARITPVGVTAFVVEHCAPATTVTTIDIVKTDGTLKTLSTNAAQGTVVVDPNGTKIFYVEADGTAKLSNATGTTIVTVDTSVTQGWISDDASTLLYSFVASGSTGGLKKTATASIAPATLLTTGFGNEIAATPSLGAMTYSTTFDATTGLGDVHLVTTASAPATPATLLSAPTSLSVGDAFTTSGSHALYLSGATTDATSGVSYGTLNAAAVAGAASTIVGTKVAAVRALVGTKVVFEDAFDVSALRGDLHVSDVATTAAPTLVAARVDLRVDRDHAGTKIVYSTHAAAAPGIYVAPVP
jgi:hypothetical protein